MEACSGDNKKVCRVCDWPKPFEAFHRDRALADGHRSICKACVSDYDAEHYVENLERYRERDKAKKGSVKVLAREAATRAHKSGILVKPARCESYGCENRPDDKHHDSYAESQWLNVRWLCGGCHADWHKGHDPAMVEGEHPQIKPRKPPRWRRVSKVASRHAIQST